MLKPLMWVFENNNFKYHFMYLVKIGLIFICLAIVLVFLMNFNDFSDLTCHFLSLFLIILISVPHLNLTGYFWYLTDNITERKTDILSANIYNKKIDFKDIIEFPEINIWKFVWRGIASIVATILMYIPVSMIFVYSSLNVTKVSEFWGWTTQQTTFFYIFLVCLIAFFIPALLWNYAKKDSVFAVWNVFEASRVIGENFVRYVKNTVLFLLYSVVYSIIIKTVTFMLGLSIWNTCDIWYTFSTHGINDIISGFLAIIFNYIAGIYWVHVNAYLLGTISEKQGY